MSTLRERGGSAHLHSDHHISLETCFMHTGGATSLSPRQTLTRDGAAVFDRSESSHRITHGES